MQASRVENIIKHISPTKLSRHVYAANFVLEQHCDVRNLKNPGQTGAMVRPQSMMSCPSICFKPLLGHQQLPIRSFSRPCSLLIL
eukprot:6188913-Pleurochrysis_carterae.AAC.2